jgi:hypothetical protein
MRPDRRVDRPPLGPACPTGPRLVTATTSSPTIAGVPESPLQAVASVDAFTQISSFPPHCPSTSVSSCFSHLGDVGSSCLSIPHPSSRIPPLTGIFPTFNTASPTTGSASLMSRYPRNRPRTSPPPPRSPTVLTIVGPHPHPTSSFYRLQAVPRRHHPLRRHQSTPAPGPIL